MNKDYLWNKDGNDAEIEHLEILLQAFRYRETALPVLPAKILPFRKERMDRIFPFVFAVAACLAFVAAGLGILSQISGNRSKAEKELAEATLTSNSIFTGAESRIEKISESGVKKTDVARKKNNRTPQQFEERKIIKIKVAPFAFRRNEVKAQNLKAVKPEIRLSEEERYAYEQLRLALSIASSKLKLVKDKVEGAEEKPNARANLK